MEFLDDVEFYLSRATTVCTEWTTVVGASDVLEESPGVFLKERHVHKRMGSRATVMGDAEAAEGASGQQHSPVASDMVSLVG